MHPNENLPNISLGSPYLGLFTGGSQHLDLDSKILGTYFLSWSVTGVDVVVNGLGDVMKG